MTTEVRERLAQSLHNAVWLTLGMEQQDYRVQRPWSATIAQQSQSPVPLAAGTRIVEVFDRPEIDRQLLILGEPGAGKTTMMLELAQDLVQRAAADKTEPIPVLISLSGWKNPKQSIFDWLVDELKGKYGIRQDLAKRWLEKNQLLPLLDGLDEVAPQHQKECAVALNAWMIGELEQRPCGVLICCRREEFEQVVRQPLSLYGAIYLQALTIEQIQDYFAQFGLQDVWQTVQQDEALQALLTTPLFLSMFGLVQTQGKFSLSDWRSRTTSEARIEYLLDTYWEAAIERELITNPSERQQGILSKTYGKKPLPTRQAVRRSLVFAAKMLDRADSTELLIEKMQPTALITWQQKWTYRLSYDLIGVLIFGLAAGLVFGLILGLAEGLTNGLVPGLTFSLGGQIAGLVFGIVFGLIVRLMDLIGEVTWGLLRLMVGRSSELITIKAVEAISVSFSRKTLQEIFRSLRGWLIWSLIGGLILGLIYRQLGDWLIGSLVFGLFGGLTTGLIYGLKGDIQTRLQPNQGIKNSLKNMVIVISFSLVYALLLKVSLQYVLNVIDIDFLSTHDPDTQEIFVNSQSSTAVFDDLKWVFTLWASILLSLSGRDGLTPHLIQHFALRVVLAWNRYAPFRYDLLLNYCTERLLLQRIGGRYRFMHKLLQDHFARMDLS